MLKNTLEMKNYNRLGEVFVWTVCGIFGLLAGIFATTSIVFFIDGVIDDAFIFGALSIVFGMLVFFAYTYILKDFAIISFNEKGIFVNFYRKAKQPLSFDYSEMKETRINSVTFRGDTNFYLEFSDAQGHKQNILLGNYENSVKAIELLRPIGVLPPEGRTPLEERKLEYDPIERRNSKVLQAIIVAILVNSCSFITGGKDWFHKVSSETFGYDGSASYTELPVYFTVTSVQEVNEDDKNLYWAYGYYPKGINKEITFNIVESSIDPSRISRIFFSPQKFSFGPDTVYYALLDIRSNYWTFPFQEKNAFEVYSYEALASNMIPQDLDVDETWRTKLVFYSFANHLQFTALFVFFIIVGYTSTMKENNGWILFQKSRRAVWVTIGLALVYIIATAYKTYIDYPFYTDLWWIWGVITNGLSLYFAYRCYQQIRDSRDYVRLTPTHLSFKDNAWEMVIPYSQITDLEITNHLDNRGTYTYNGRIQFSNLGKKIMIPLARMNLGECDMEIYEALKDATEPKKPIE